METKRKSYSIFTRRKGYRGAGIALFREEPQGTFSVLLGKRKYNPGKGQWSFPGGKAKRKEIPFEAAKREFREETGVNLEELKPIYISHIRTLIPFFDWDTFIISTTSHMVFTQVGEFDVLEWVDESVLNRLDLHFGVRQACKAYRKYRNRTIEII